METHTSTAFRIRYRRSGWNPSRIKASDIYPSLRRAVSQAHKLNNATRRFMLTPIEELYIERGVIMWSTDRIEVEDFEVIEREAAVEDNVWVTRWKSAYSDLDREPTREELEVWIERHEEDFA